jgi:protoporphyrinogen oxidase
MNVTDAPIKGVIGSFDPFKKTVIWGAGISGLTLAWALKKRGFSVQINEKNKIAGGKIHTKQCQYGIAESAANAIYATEAIKQWCTELGIAYIQSNSGLKKKIFRNSILKNFPLNLKELFQILIKLSYLKIKITDFNEVTVEEFFTPLLGKKITHQVLGAMLVGIYATSVKHLRFLSVFKTLPEKNEFYWHYFKRLLLEKKSHRATSISFQNGMGELIDCLSQKLHDNLVFEVNDFKFSQDYNHILACDALEASTLLEINQIPWGNSLKLFTYQELACTTYFLKEPLRDLHKSFGVVRSVEELIGEQKIIGILNNTAIFPGRVFDKNHFSYTVISFEKEDNKKNDLQLQKEFCDLMNINFQTFQSTMLIESSKASWKRAIPTLDINHYNILKKVYKNCLRHQSLAIFGNYTGNLSIREIISEAENFAESMVST